MFFLEMTPSVGLNFNTRFINKLREDPIFYRRLLWSDERTFGKNGNQNRFFINLVT
jgi:hypothetical protein